MVLLHRRQKWTLARGHPGQVPSDRLVTPQDTGVPGVLFGSPARPSKASFLEAAPQFAASPLDCFVSWEDFGGLAICFVRRHRGLQHDYCLSFHWKLPGFGGASTDSRLYYENHPGRGTAFIMYQ